MSNNEISCVALMSGGLDSMLAAALMKKQGVVVYGVAFNIGAGTIPVGGVSKPHPAIKAAASVGVPIEIIDMSGEYINILLNPKYGYGSAANPCVDCHTDMIRRALIYMKEKGARFVITGEVKGQRPKSQNSQMLDVVAKKSGAADLLLRPMSAKLFPPSLPEREGWVDREKLLDISGRSRIRQMALAEEFGIKEYATPGGGCLYTEKFFADKFFDLLEKGKQNVTITDLKLLKAGRHFRLAPDLKIIIGRNADENDFLMKTAAPQMGIMEAVEVAGPTAVVDGNSNDEQINLAASMVARYGQGRNKPVVKVKYLSGGVEKFFDVEPMKPEAPERWKI